MTGGGFKNVPTFVQQRFRELDPLMPTSLIQNNPIEAKVGSPANYILMGKYKFINDTVLS